MTSHLLVAIATITKLFYCFLNEVSSTFGIEPILKDIESYQGHPDSYDVPICSTDTFYVFKREHLGTRIATAVCTMPLYENTQNLLFLQFNFLGLRHHVLLDLAESQYNYILHI